MKLFKNNMFHDKRVAQISHKLNIKEHVIEEVLDIMYTYIKLKIESVEFSDAGPLLTKDEFEETFPTIQIPSLGYFVPSYKRYTEIMKSKKK